MRLSPEDHRAGVGLLLRCRGSGKELRPLRSPPPRRDGKAALPGCLAEDVSGPAETAPAGVAEPKIVDFKPRWMRELSEEDRRVLDNFSVSGSVPPGPPRINARLLPVGGSSKVSAKTLGEAISLTQSI